ncbi:zinc finger protein [Capsaspora owczarzaki ATCC 30864]|uniref:Zinc finger protein n=2 Tax=Capsaspora owczarzaki (strain ATCC 30864) TaxID=595528 RepID=A0A0D2X4S2_CAPO3|nr:zinc finger protein [Capsaspora owczarzaki ATCC 30864]
MFKKSSQSRPSNLRRRDGDEDEPATAVPSTAAAAAERRVRSQVDDGANDSDEDPSKLKTATKQPAADDADDSDDDASSDDDGEDGDDRKAGHVAKRARLVTTGLDAGTSSTLSAASSSDGSKLATPFEAGRQSLEQRNGGPRMYNEADPVLRKGEATSTGLRGFRAAPMKAAANIRTTVRFDYQMDVCKDYKETGFCGFGDTCKFMHDRGDYKTGWQLDKEWDEHKKAADSKPKTGAKEVFTRDDDLPFACHICRGDFVNPVVTRCKHYFCEKCALEHAKKSSLCAVCQSATNGMFNRAKDLADALKRRQKRQDDSSQKEHEQAMRRSAGNGIANDDEDEIEF